MSTPSAPPAQGAGRGGRPRHYRRPRRGGAQNGTAPIPGAPRDTPAQPTLGNATAVPPAPVAQAAPGSNPNPNRRNNGQSSRGRGGRPGQRGGAPRHVMGGAGGRAFGGQLTSAGGASGGSAPLSLQADAPAFTPGQTVVPRTTATHNHPPPNIGRQRRFSKSQAADIATRTHEDILHGLYECPICTSEVLKNSKVWSCKTCWTVFHLSCVKKWAKNEGSTQQNRQQLQEGELPPARQWRCPGCNLPKDDMPESYTCWCAKDVDPKAIPGLPPHSCGQTCGKPRAPRNCPHPCDLICHAGPCPPCPHMGPVQACFCGKDEVSKRCIDTHYDSGWSCGKKCGDMMPCGEHECVKGCHEGLCGSCEVLVESRCYCGKVEKMVPCSDRGDEKDSSIVKDDNEVDNWTGSFECGNVCKRAYDCGRHFCEKSCHEQTADVPHCPLSPDVITHCPCGKSTLKDLDCTRSSCEEPIPHCQKLCLKQLACGHECQQKCHEGECLPCLKVVPIVCRCGRTTSSTICHQGTEALPQCMRICKTALNCGRHECGEHCCPGEKPAGERIAAKRKQKVSRGTTEDYEAEHICTRVCGRDLKCGNPEHTCQELCHRGACGACREAIFDEISCNCGRTVLHPPLPCGTQPPPCPHQCNRRTACGHPAVNHQCHGDGESCPKCPYLVQKTCMCGKKILKNQPCWSTQISCGQTCGHRLRCGIHSCQKPCHRAGDCEDALLTQCPHVCGKTKTTPGCGHICLEPCHAPYPCKEDKPCQAKVIITCACQHLKQEVRCLATKATPVTERKTLACDDECLRLQRNAKLAAALNIPSDHTDDHIPYSAATLDFFKGSPKWCQTQEREFRVFAADTTAKQFRFKPMSAAQRAFLHSLAEDFALDTESVDPEPHRHVVLFKAPRFTSAPMKTLSQCLKLRPVVEAPKNAPATTGVPFNALLLANPRFALTLDELRAAVASDPATAQIAGWKIEFLPSEEIVVRASLADGVDEATLQRLKPALTKVVLEKELAGAVALCAVDASLNVARREDTGSAGGWSQVVKGAPVKKRVVDEWAASGKNSFTVLGSKAAGKKKEKEKGKERERQESVVENWEDAVGAWEESAEGATGAVVAGAVDETEVADASAAEEAPVPASGQTKMPDVE
ncbi:FKBP12-associated protein [Pseudogymnoascus verrucosus]|uniref:FKBP12-associated protein n=1 Tax=Pseudogymnoascus verrucosus TaxID=342668 RepID=A0A1B8GWF0_9PEZI|nr:FKBP12-associated protein [Pseudogymnoascus verrucosus]OBU00165.1 FKBP12-associated protein [Pseudogymnoascus verrucosus]